MAKLNARSKGASGEREFCKYLQEHFNLEELPTRNLNQTREGGVDVLCNPFAFEVKRREVLNYVAWWTQVTTATNNPKDIAFGLEPVVAFRQNGKQWEFLISAKHIGLTRGFVHVSSYVFDNWVKKYLSFADKVEPAKQVSMDVKRLAQ